MSFLKAIFGLGAACVAALARNFRGSESPRFPDAPPRGRPSRNRHPGRKPLSGYKLVRRYFPGITRDEALQRFSPHLAQRRAAHARTA